MKRRITIIACLVILVLLILSMVLISIKKNNVITSKDELCSKYSIYGNIYYDEENKNYNIKNITYCESFDITKYKTIRATLFEKDDNLINEITFYEYNDNTLILLDKFLTGKTFDAKYSKYICMNYKKEVLYLEVKVTTSDDRTNLINIPLFMDEKCK